MSISLVLLIIGAMFIVAEVIIGIDTGFDLLLIGSCVLVGGILGYYTNDYVAAAAAGGLSVAYIVLGRKFVKNKVQAFTHTSNVDSLLNKVITLKSWDSAAKTGSANINGEDWRVVSDSPLSEGQSVVVTNIDGVSLVVKPQEE